jgi:hypothetical protein
MLLQPAAQFLSISNSMKPNWPEIYFLKTVFLRLHTSVFYVYSPMTSSGFDGRNSRVARFFMTQYTKTGGKDTKLPLNYQMAVIYSK